MTEKCTHLGSVKEVTARTTEGCEECLAENTPWVQLRLCLECGHVGCCDSSIGKHATKHFEATKHPIMQSFTPGESWRWCYADKMKV